MPIIFYLMDSNEKLREKFAQFITLSFTGILLSFGLLYFFLYDDPKAQELGGLRLECTDCAKDLSPAFTKEMEALSNHDNEKHNEFEVLRSPSQVSVRPLEIRWKATAKSNRYAIRVWQKMGGIENVLADTETKQASITVTPISLSRVYWSVFLVSEKGEKTPLSTIGEIDPH